MAQQIKSKQRVTDHGEVFTNEREVNAMLDLVKQETERIDSRFLEPACGEGAFLTEILRRKLSVVKSRYAKNAFDYERYSVQAVMSIYGVDILEDNAAICRDNLFEIWDKEYTAICKVQANDECREVVKFILQTNIICGDALTMKQNNGTAITFAEWSFVCPAMVKRRDYQLDVLLSGNEQEYDIFNWHYDNEIKVFIPNPVCEYPLMDYRRLADHG